MRKIRVNAGKEGLASTEQVQKLIAIADFELQKFGSRARRIRSRTSKYERLLLTTARDCSNLSFNRGD